MKGPLRRGDHEVENPSWSWVPPWQFFVASWHPGAGRRIGRHCFTISEGSLYEGLSDGPDDGCRGG